MKEPADRDVYITNIALEINRFIEKQKEKLFAYNTSFDRQYDLMNLVKKAIKDADKVIAERDSPVVTQSTASPEHQEHTSVDGSPEGDGSHECHRFDILL